MKSTINKFVLRLKGVKCHKTSLIHTLRIGTNTRVWAFVNISKNSRIGQNCNICDHCFIEDSVEIGDNVTSRQVSLWAGVTIEHNVFSPGVQFCNDKYLEQQHIEQTTVLKWLQYRCGSVVLPGITIHEGAMIGAGSVV